jgi:hypothetical protein
MARRSGFSGRGMIKAGVKKAKKSRTTSNVGKAKFIRAKNTGEPLRAARMLAGY